MKLIDEIELLVEKLYKTKKNVIKGVLYLDIKLKFSDLRENLKCDGCGKITDEHYCADCEELARYEGA